MRRFIVALCALLALPLFAQNQTSGTKTGGIILRGFMELKEQAAPATSVVDWCSIYGDSTSHTLKIGCNGGAFSDLLTQATGDARYVELTDDFTTTAEAAAAAPVQSVFGRTGTVTALQADYDAFFTTPAEAAAVGPVSSVFGRTGAVVAVQADYDSFFLTQTEGDGRYAQLAASNSFAAAQTILAQSAAVSDGLTLTNPGNAGLNRGTAVLFRIPSAASAVDGGRVTVAESAASDDNTYMRFDVRVADVISESLRLSSVGAQFSGSVGVGSAPAYPFDVRAVSGTAIGNGGSIIARIADTTGNRGVYFGNGIAANEGSIAAISSGAASKLRLLTYSGGGWNDVMTLDGSGNVGIGGASSGARLHLNGAPPTFAFQNTANLKSSNSVSGIVNFLDSAGAEYAWFGDGSSSVNAFTLYAGTTHTLTMYSLGANVLSFGTGSTASFLGAITFSGNGTSAAGSIFKGATDGFNLRGATGSVNDVRISNSTDATVMTVPTGTQNAEFAGSIKVSSAGTKPTCNSTNRFVLWTTAGGTGVKDSVEICGKDAADSYAWRTIY